MTKVICLFHKLEIDFKMITSALIDHKTCAIYIGGRSQASFTPKGKGRFINVNLTSLGLLHKFVNQEGLEV